MSINIRNVKDMTDLIAYFAEKMQWKIDPDDFEDIEDVAYDFEAEDIGLKEEAFAKIDYLFQLPPLVDGQKWGIFCVEFDSRKFEVTALRKILSGLIPKRRNSVDHAVWDQKDLLFLCFWGKNNDRTIGIAHFEEKESGLPTIKMISCAPAIEDFTQIRVFENRLKNLQWPANYMDHDRWHKDWSSAFTTAYRQTIQDASTLTTKLAIEAQGIRNRILEILDVETANGYVHLLYDKFKDTLIHDMTEAQFADMYAQTVVYGLFSARCMDDTQDDFSVLEAVERIPNTNPFLKSLMQECLGTQNTSKLSFDELEIGNVVDLLLHTRTDVIIQDFNRQTGGGREDPVIHFYEEFLTAYDKQQKVQRGVYYTPQPIVNFIVKAVDSVIKTEFDLEDGLASTETKKIKFMREAKKRSAGKITRGMVEDEKEVPAIQILDPATGTGTFIRQVILQIYENFKKKNEGMNEQKLHDAWNQYVPTHLLPRINAFELMMAPYAVAHMKLAMVLKDTGYEFKSNGRLNVFLTNSLEEPGDSDNQITLWSDPLAMESVSANGVKKNTGINICLGNPPYAGESANKGKWILKLINDYKTEPGGVVKLQEKNPKWLNDDYVKFIKLGQEYIKKTQYGIVAYICPHGFIDNPTFRGMRWQLATSFDSIYILDLHGNAKKREVSPDGSKDENVFDIQQGVCIVLMIYKSSKKNTLAKIFHADVFGSRESKYAFLNTAELKNIPWKEVNSSEPFYLFKPTSLVEDIPERFDVSSLFIHSVMGFQTHRDNFAIAFTKNEISDRVDDMLNNSISDEQMSLRYSISNNRDWQINSARQRLHAMSEEQIEEKLTLCQYRLFDTRWCFLDESFMDYPRGNVFCNVSNKNNIVFGVGRQGLAIGDVEWCLATVSKYAMDANIFRRGGVTASPLYIYDENVLYDTGRIPNLKESIIKRFEEKIGLEFVSEKTKDSNTFAPVDVLDYILAVLYSHKYREKYKDELRINYPQIPYPTTLEYFKSMSLLGTQLRMLITMENINLTNDFLASDGSNLIDRYKLINNKIYINKNQYFYSETNAELKQLWDYTIGGTQPLQKWLKDRKGTQLTKKDIEMYLYIISATSQIIRIMDNIDIIIKC